MECEAALAQRRILHRADARTDLARRPAPAARQAGGERRRVGSVPAVASPSARRDRWLLALALLVLYCVLGQDSFYRIDGEYLLWMDVAERPSRGYHSFYRFVFDGLFAVAEPIGLSRFETARFASALGTAIGAAWLHALGPALGLGRGESLWCALAAGLSPAWLFFATVVEVHGVFLPFAVAATHAQLLAVRRPTLPRATAAGLALGLAYLAHPTGALLLFQMPLLASLAGRRLGLLPFALAAGGLLAIVALGSVLLPALGTGVRADQPLTILLDGAADLTRPVTWGRTLWIEWLLPFAPLSVLWLRPWAGRTRRRIAAGFVLLLVPYLTTAQLLAQHGGEHGAYLLPLAWIAALCCRPVGRALGLAVLASGFAIGVARIVAHDDPEPPRAYAAGFRALAGDGPLLLLGHQRDFAAYFLHLDDLPLVFVGDVVTVNDPIRIERWVAGFDAAARRHLASGRRLFLSQDAWANLRTASRTGRWPLTDDPPTAVTGAADAPRALLRLLENRYRLEPVRALGFRGFELRLR